MIVLFVRSGNSGPDPITTNQGESLRAQGMDVRYFDVTGRGLFGYLRNIPKIRKKVKEIKPQIIHAHYSLTGFLVKLAVPERKIVCSLMGSDVNDSSGFKSLLLKLFVRYGWAKTIIKSKQLEKKIGLAGLSVIPNGVNLTRFQPMDRNTSRKRVGFEEGKSYILFASDPTRPEKNFKFAEEIINDVKTMHYDVALFPLKSISLENMPLYYSAADALLLTSVSEGSPNVIKEAMACNCPIVATDVGDIRGVVGGTSGCTISDFEKDSMVNAIIDLLKNPKRTNGRNNIVMLDDRVIAGKLMNIYEEVIRK